MKFSNFERAKKILDFFSQKAKRKDGRFFNAYYATNKEPAEYVVHTGPNIWLGIAAARYIYITQDNAYLAFAQDIASKVMEWQNCDKDGGLRGGLDVKWYSTEHNLSAYAFFNMLYKITGKRQYQDAADKTLKWLVKYAYNERDIPVKRGKGDSVIATDVYALSIAAIGPEILEELGLSIEGILDFAQKNCALEVFYTLPEGKIIRVKGFDFASQKHVARSGVVSSEWTAQMIIAFKKMGDFYRKKGLEEKAKNYFLKADEYLSNLSSLIILSPSPFGRDYGCLPYATQDNIDTGHGWFTPRGAFTGSLAGTAYAFLAYYNYNPLELP